MVRSAVGRAGQFEEPMPPVLDLVAPVPGVVLVVSFAAYIVLRQSHFRLRAERLGYSWRRSQLVTEGR